MKLGPRRKYHEGQVALRHYANQTSADLMVLCIPQDPAWVATSGWEAAGGTAPASPAPPAPSPWPTPASA